MNETEINLKLLVDGEEASDSDTDNIAVLEYIDNDDSHADDLQMALYDADFLEDKTKLTVSFVADNWHGTNKSAVLECGTFHIDDKKYSELTDTHIVKAAATTAASSVRQEKKNRAWERINLKELAGEIAGQNELQLIYAAQLNPVFVRKEQLETSDIRFLADLCISVGLSMKFTTNSIVIYSPYEYGELKPVRTFEYGEAEIKECKPHHKENDTAYGKCCVSYKDPVTGEMIGYTYIRDKAGRTLKVSRKVSSTEEARLAARYAIMEKNSKEFTGYIECDGDITLAAGSVIALKGYGEYDMKYIVKKAVHILRGSTYTTQIQFEMVLEGY